MINVFCRYFSIEIIFFLIEPNHDENVNQSNTSVTETLLTAVNIPTASPDSTIDSYQHDFKTSPSNDTENNGMQHNSSSIPTLQPYIDPSLSEDIFDDDVNDNQSTTSVNKTLSMDVYITTASPDSTIDSYQHDLKSTPSHHTENKGMQLNFSSTPSLQPFIDPSLSEDIYDDDENDNQSTTSVTKTLSTALNTYTASPDSTIDSYQQDFKTTPSYNTENNESFLTHGMISSIPTIQSIPASGTKVTDLLHKFDKDLKSVNKELHTISKDLKNLTTKMQTSNANQDDFEEIIKKLNNTREILIIKIGLIEQKLNDFQNTTNNLDSSIENQAAKLQDVDKNLLKLNTSWQNVDGIIRNLDSKMQDFMKLFSDTKKGKSY